MASGGDVSQPWLRLAAGYERARAREDSLDRLVEWPAQRATLRAARAMLSDDGFILLTRTHPIRYAVERAEQNGTSLGEEYFATGSFSYRHAGWSDDVALTKRPYTIADLLNTFSAAGLRIEATVEPQLSDEARARYPHKQAWIDKHLGIPMFKLRPLTV